jgi:hypothetical protein
MIAAGLHARLLDGIPPRVCGMAEAIVAEWEQAVTAVPELVRLAAEDIAALADLPAAEREEALRRRWGRLHALPEMPAVDLRGAPQRRSVGGRRAAAR